MIKKREREEDLSECPQCGAYLRREEGFICPRCKRGPFCRRHRIPGERACAGCILETKSKEISYLKGQERSIKGFVLLLQFIFLVCAIFFVAGKIGLGEFMKLLKIDIIATYSIHIGLIALLASFIFYVVLRSQRARMIELESLISKIRYERN